MRQDRLGKPVTATDPATVAAVNDHVLRLLNDEVRLSHILDAAEADGDQGG